MTTVAWCEVASTLERRRPMEGSFRKQNLQVVDKRNLQRERGKVKNVPWFQSESSWRYDAVCWDLKSRERREHKHGGQGLPGRVLCSLLNGWDGGVGRLALRRCPQTARGQIPQTGAQIYESASQTGRLCYKSSYRAIMTSSPGLCRN